MRVSLASRITSVRVAIATIIRSLDVILAVLAMTVLLQSLITLEDAKA